MDNNNTFDVLKAKIDLLALPGANTFVDANGQEWVLIPSVTPEEYEKIKQGKLNKDNPCRMYPQETKYEDGRTYSHRYIDLDIQPTHDPNNKMGYTHNIKFYRGDKSIDKNAKEQNVWLGNCKTQHIGNYRSPNQQFGTTPRQAPQPQIQSFASAAPSAPKQEDNNPNLPF